MPEEQCPNCRDNSCYRHVNRPSVKQQLAEVFCTHTLGPWEILKFNAQWEVLKINSSQDDWTGAHFMIRSPNAPGGIALVMGGLGLPEETANAALIAAAPAMLRGLRTAMHALRSYQHGNISTELAEEVADSLEKVIREISSHEHNPGITPCTD